MRTTKVNNGQNESNSRKSETRDGAFYQNGNETEQGCNAPDTWGLPFILEQPVTPCAPSPPPQSPCTHIRATGGTIIAVHYYGGP